MSRGGSAVRGASRSWAACQVCSARGPVVQSPQGPKEALEQALAAGFTIRTQGTEAELVCGGCGGAEDFGEEIQALLSGGGVSVLGEIVRKASKPS